MVKIPHEIVLIHMTNILLQHPKHMLGNVNSAAVAFFYHGHRINNSIQFVNTQSRQYRANIAPQSHHATDLPPHFTPYNLECQYLMKDWQLQALQFMVGYPVVFVCGNYNAIV